MTLLRTLSSMFSKGDVLLADCLMSNWRNLFMLKQRGVDVVTRLNKALRKADFSKGTLLGKDDHVVAWPKPWIRGIDRETQKSMPKHLMVRECKIDIKQPGFRTKEIIIVTTLLDPVLYTKEDLANLYLQRWNNELDLRTIKTEMKMECLRCKTPELVRKENLDAYDRLQPDPNDDGPRPPTSMACCLEPSVSKARCKRFEPFTPFIAIQGKRHLNESSALSTLAQCHRASPSGRSPESIRTSTGQKEAQNTMCRWQYPETKQNFKS